MMALPAVAILVGGRFVAAREITDASGSGWAWLGVYVVVLALGWWLGSVTLHAWG